MKNTKTAQIESSLKFKLAMAIVYGSLLLSLAGLAWHVFASHYTMGF